MSNKGKNKKEIKVGIFIDNMGIMKKNEIKNNTDINSKNLLLDIWNTIEMKLKMTNKYKINREIIEENDYDKSLEIMRKKNFDILIGAFEPTLKRREKTNFSETFLICTPTIIYQGENEKTKFFSYFKYLLKLWIKPLILLLIIGFLLSILLYKFVNIDIMHSLYYTIGGLFGARSGILKSTDKKNPIKLFFGIFTLFIVYFFTIYINATTTAKSVHYFKKALRIENTIRGLRILSFQGWLYREVEKNGGIPIKVPEGNYDIMQYYIDNREKLKLDGFITLPLNRDISRAKKKGLSVSELILNRYHASFPISLKNKQLSAIVNKQIRNLKDTKKLLNMCSLWTDQNYVMC